MADEKKNEEIILKELALLGEMRRLHEWTAYTHSEAEKTERDEANINKTPSAMSEVGEEEQVKGRRIKMATESKEICPVCGCSIVGEPYEQEGVMYCCEPCATGGGCECECCASMEEGEQVEEQPKNK